MLDEKESVLNFEIANELFRYEKDSGLLFWKKRRKNSRANLNKSIGSAHNDGHLVVCMSFNSKKYNFYVHRIVWLIFHGEWPSGAIDHANGNPLDNRLENLRIATARQNSVNSQRRKKIGFKGVYPNTSGNTYRARIQIDGKSKNLGSFASELDAHHAYIAESKKLYGDFAYVPPCSK